MVGNRKFSVVRENVPGAAAFEDFHLLAIHRLDLKKSQTFVILLDFLYFRLTDFRRIPANPLLFLSSL